MLEATEERNGPSGLRDDDDDDDDDAIFRSTISVHDDFPVSSKSSRNFGEPRQFLATN